MNTILKTNNLSKKYGQVLAVNNANMNIEQGDIYGFVGKNGAGKTTLIRMITGLVNKSSGSYDLFDVNDDQKGIYEVRRKTSAVVETPSIHLNMSAKQNLLVQCDLLGINDPNIIEDTLQTVGLHYLLNNNKKAKQFSLGMKQRLGIAIALIGNPEFLLLDEPMNGLDPEGIIEVRELLIKLNKERNITILISSHILTELSKIATKYGFIDKGVIIKEITHAELEKSCQKSIEITVDNQEGAFAILQKELNLKNIQKINQSKIRIFDSIDITTLVTTFQKNNVILLNYATTNDNIEDYYMNLIGGRNHA